MNKINDNLDSVTIYLNELKLMPLLTIEEEKELIKKLLEGEKDAKSIFIERNLRLVVLIAKDYTNLGLPLADLIQEGNLGLMTAINKFDPLKGYRFSTYAATWIRQFILRGIEKNSRSLRLSHDLCYKISQYKKVKNNLEIKLNRSATIEEIANQMNLSIKKIKELQKYEQDAISLDITVGEKNDELSFFITDKNENVEDIIIKKLFQEELHKVLYDANLTSEEIEILKLRNGFNGNDPLTFTEIAEEYNLSKSRVEQIEKEALHKIRLYEETKKLAIYTTNYQESLENLEKKVQYFLLKKKERNEASNKRYQKKRLINS